MVEHKEHASELDPMNADGVQLPPDKLNALIGVLTRREVEARLLAPLIEALADTFDRHQVLDAIRSAVVGIARQQGREMRQQLGGDSLRHFAESLKFWSQDQALELDVIEQSETVFAFNVTRCRYAEMYHHLGIPELGDTLSCSRDFALIEGFNPEIRLNRTQTIMQGAAWCDFRYRR